MAHITFIRCKSQAKLFRKRSAVSFFVHLSNRHSSQENNVDLDLDEESILEAEEEDRLQQLQNVSRLPPKMFEQYHNIAVQPCFNDLQRKRKMYMTYGSKSGEDPRLLWPSRQELAKFQQDDCEEEIPLHDKIRLLEVEGNEALKAKLNRHKMIEKNMSQMNKWISEYYKKVEASESEIEKRKEKKEMLLDEAREYFGYRIKANDPKFQQMIEEKEERERKEAKELRKKEKARKLAERLKQDVLAMKISSGEETKPDKAS